MTSNDHTTGCDSTAPVAMIPLWIWKTKPTKT